MQSNASARQSPNLLPMGIKRKGLIIMLKVTYIEHSGFLLETENASFLFDYYKGTLPQFSRNDPPLFSGTHPHTGPETPYKTKICSPLLRSYNTLSFFKLFIVFLRPA